MLLRFRGISYILYFIAHKMIILSLKSKFLTMPLRANLYFPFIFVFVVVIVIVIVVVVIIIM